MPENVQEGPHASNGLKKMVRPLRLARPGCLVEDPEWGYMRNQYIDAIGDSGICMLQFIFSAAAECSLVTRRVG